MVLKSKFFTLLIIFLLSSCATQRKNSNHLIDTVEFKHTLISSTINKKILEIKTIFNLNNSVIIIHNSEESESKNIQLTFFEKIDFNWFLKNVNSKPYGYLIIDKSDVFIFGNSSNAFFTKTKKDVEFTWLKIEKLHKHENTIVPIIEKTIEPPVWIYKYNNEKVSYQGVKYFDKNDFN